MSKSSDKKLKVLHVIATLGRGGAERELTNIVTNSDSSAFEHLVCHLRRPDDFAGDIKKSGSQVINLNVKRRNDFLTISRKLSRIVDEHQPDIIHCWMFEASMGTRLLYLKGKRLPIVTSIQNVDYEKTTIKNANLSLFKIRAIQWLDKISGFLTPQFYVPCSEFVKESSVKYLSIPEKNTQIIYNSVDPGAMNSQSAVAEKIRSELGLPDNAVVFLNVGRLDPQKAQSVLLKAFQQALEKCPNAYLLIAGEGTLETKLKNLAAELNAAGNIKFLGKRKDIPALMEMADVFVFPSLFEGFSLALVEAMYKKMACIVSDIAPNIEAVENSVSGLLVKSNDIASLSEAIIRVYLDAELRNNLGFQAHKRADEKFNSLSITQQWQNLYNELTNRQN